MLSQALMETAAPPPAGEHALLAVVQEAYVHGVSTRTVDDLVKAVGVDGISKSEVSRICGELDTVVAAFRTRPLTGEDRYLPPLPMARPLCLCTHDEQDLLV